MLEYENSDLQDIVGALLRLQALKIEREYDIVADAILMTFSFEGMQEILIKRDQEVERINAETEKELAKYKAKTSLHHTGLK
jgi:hypothetical protein